MMFFITGAPRSRTAWFSLFMSAHPDIHCYHEASNGVHEKQHFYELMEREDIPVVGNSDCGLPWTDFQERWPDAPTLILHRDAFQRPWSGVNGLHVRFEHIDARLEEIFEHLIGYPVDPDIVALYSRMNIQLKEVTADPVSLKLWGIR